MKRKYQLSFDPIGERYHKDPMNNRFMSLKKPQLNVFVLGGALWTLFIVASLIT